MGRIKRIHWRAAVLGFLFGLILPLVGVFLGLQVSPFLGTVLAFPLIAVGWIMDAPIGHLSTASRLAAVLMSGLVWSFVFGWTAAALRSGRP